MRFKTSGIIAAMVTPFTEGGEYVDFDKIGAVAALLVKRGASGLFVCGTTGEGMLLTPDERREVLAEAILTTSGKAQIIAHTGALDTATTIELTQHAQESGADGAAVVAPPFYGYDDQSLYQHFSAVARAVPDFPVLLYNIPGCAVNSLSAELVLRLAEDHDNIVGMKDSSGNMKYITQLLGTMPKGFHVINGADEYGFQAFVAGVSAAVSGTANVVGELYAGIYNNVKKDKLPAAWKQQVKLEHACRIFQYGRMLGVFKEGMRLRGFDPGYVRPPQRELTTEEKKSLAQKMKAAGLI